MKPPFKHYRNLIRHSELAQPTEPWFVKYWRAAAAWIYLSICVFDFVVMPLYVTQHNLSTDQIMVIAEKLRPEDRLTAIIQLEKKNAWIPLTLAESGMFHIAFGAILGVAAWSRGQLQTAQVQNGIFPTFEEPRAPGLPAMPNLTMGSSSPPPFSNPSYPNPFPPPPGPPTNPFPPPSPGPPPPSTPHGGFTPPP